MKSAADIIEYIQARGERITLPRRLVVEALGLTHDHRTISDIQQIIKQQKDQPLSDTTIYRVLQWLKELGLVSQTDMGQAGTVYALNSSPQHHHLICLNCGNTITIPDDLFVPFREQLRLQFDFDARIDHMAIYGHCRNCASDPD